MNRLTTLVAAIALTVAGATEAQSQNYAKVLSSSPIYDRVSTNEEICYRRDNHRRRDSGTDGAVLGAIVGGALGNQIGRGDGRRAATVAGVVAGAVLGRDIDRRDRHRYVCEQRPNYRNAVIGYDVTYRYRGRSFYGQVPYRPGRRIPIVVYYNRGRMDVQPVDRIM